MKKLSNKKFTAKQLAARIGAIMATGMLMCTTVLADGDNLGKATNAVVDLLKTITTIALVLVIAAGSLYCIILGVKFAKAEEPQDREKAKSHLQNAVIGFVLIFVLILALNLLPEILGNWVNDNVGNDVIDTSKL